MRILLLGDIVGSPGRRVVARLLPALRERERVDFVIANAENAAGGRGVTLALADELFAAGADALTLGDHVWDQKELAAHIEREPRLLRPLNLPPGCPGRGIATFPTPAGPVTVLSLLGRTFMGALADCPFRAADAALRGPPRGGAVVVEVHAEATSEKIALGWHLDGRAAAVVGTHTHVQTADETIRPRGTAYLSDLGMCGPRDSVLGREKEPIIRRFLTGMPVRFDIAERDVWLEGALVDVDPANGRATAIRRLQLPEE